MMTKNLKIQTDHMHSPCAVCNNRFGHSFDENLTDCQKCEYNIYYQILCCVVHDNDFCSACKHMHEFRSPDDCYYAENCPDNFELDFISVLDGYNIQTLTNTHKIGMAYCDLSDNESGVRICNFYTHPKGWYVIRFKDIFDAQKVANKMIDASKNSNLIFNHRDRYNEIIERGINSEVETACCAPSLIRECIIEALDVDPGEFFTWTEDKILQSTNLFEPTFTFETLNRTPVEIGDILVTQTAGTTAIVVE